MNIHPTPKTPHNNAAYQTLKEWGIDVKKPVFLEAVR